MSEHAYQPTLAQLRAFAAVAEYRHFGTAAHKLTVSQPTLSQALAALEHGLGVQLIERSTRRVLVTTAGQELLPQALATLEAADRFIAAAAGLGDGLSGPLRVGFIPTVAPHVLPALLPALRRTMPDLALHVVEEPTARLLDNLRAGLLDVAVLATPTDAHGFTEIPVFRDEFVLVVPRGHRLAESMDVPLRALGELPLLLLDEGHCLRAQTLELCRSADVHPEIGVDTRAASLTTVAACVAGGLGVAVLPAIAVPAEAAADTVAVARFAAPAPGRTIGLIFRGSSTRASDYERLADMLRSIAPVAADVVH